MTLPGRRTVLWCLFAGCCYGVVWWATSGHPGARTAPEPLAVPDAARSPQTENARESAPAGPAITSPPAVPRPRNGEMPRRLNGEMLASWTMPVGASPMTMLGSNLVIRQPLPDGLHVQGLAPDGQMLWDRPFRTRPQDPAPRLDWAVSADGTRLALRVAAGPLLVLDQGGAVLRSITLPETGRALPAFVAGDRFLIVSGGSDTQMRTLYWYELHSIPPRLVRRTEGAPVAGAARAAMVAVAAGSLSIFNAEGRAAVASDRFGPDEIAAVEVAAGGEHVLARTSSALYLYGPKGERIWRRPAHSGAIVDSRLAAGEGAVWLVTATPEGAQLAYAAADGSVQSATAFPAGARPALTGLVAAGQVALVKDGGGRACAFTAAGQALGCADELMVTPGGAVLAINGQTVRLLIVKR